MECFSAIIDARLDRETTVFKLPSIPVFTGIAGIGK
jgi:hypothetical protein